MPSEAQQQRVQSFMQSVVSRVDDIPNRSLRRLLPVLLESRRELKADLERWLATAPDGNDRYTAHHLRKTLAAMDLSIKRMGETSKAVARELRRGGEEAAGLAAANLKGEITRLTGEFDGVHQIAPPDLATAADLLDKNRWLVGRYESSARRYGTRGQEALRRQFALGVSKGETWHQMANRIMRLRSRPGGRFGLASPDVAGRMAGGLFYGQFWQAERLVRTEMIHAYNAHHHEALLELAADPDEGERWKRRWDSTADRRRCVVCADLDGQIAGPDEPFPGGHLHPPAHPNCRCVVTPWDEEWGEMESDEGEQLGPDDVPDPVVTPTEADRQKALEAEARAAEERRQEDARRREAERKAAERKAAERARREAELRAIEETRRKAEAERKAAEERARQERLERQRREREARKAELARRKAAEEAARKSEGAARKRGSEAAEKAMHRRFRQLAEPLAKIRDPLADKEVQFRVRSGMRSIMSEAGIPTQDRPQRDTCLVVAPRQIGDASGTHDWTGRVLVSHDTADRAEKFVKKAQAGKPVGIRDAEAFSTYVHEEIHGAKGAIGKNGYTHHGAVIEEVTTELSARRIMREQFGSVTMKGGEWNGRKVSEAFQVRKDRPMLSAYQREIGSVSKAFQDALEISQDEADDLLDRASIAFRRKKTGSPQDAPSPFVKEFVKHVPGLNVGQRSDLLMALRKLRMQP